MSDRTVPRVKFKKDWDFKPSQQSTVGYRKGWEGPVTQACADAAVKAGVADLLTGAEPKKIVNA